MTDRKKSAEEGTTQPKSRRVDLRPEQGAGARIASDEEVEKISRLVIKRQWNTLKALDQIGRDEHNDGKQPS